MKRADIKNVKCQQKTPKGERILTFALCNFHFTMLYSRNRLWRIREYKSLS